MPLKNILVHLDRTQGSRERLELALAIGRRHQAAVTGFFATPATYFSQGGETQPREELQAEGVELAQRAGVALDWVTDDDTRAGQSQLARVTRQAYFSDLVVIGQPGANPGPKEPLRDFPERLLLASGRPVLSVPYAGNFPNLGERIMVAWKTGRLSARALADAMPFLVRAKSVYLVSFVDSVSERELEEHSHVALARHLRLHGVEAVSEVRKIHGIGVGDALLNRVAEEGIDLVVAGGTTPNQSGPMASHLLRDMAAPILMSS